LPACAVFFCVLRVLGDYLVFGLLDRYGFNGLFAICGILKVFGHGFWLKIGFFFFGGGGGVLGAQQACLLTSIFCFFFLRKSGEVKEI